MSGDNNKDRPGSLNINVSGGSQIGAVTQGDGARVTANVTRSDGGISSEDIQALRAELEALATSSEVSFAEMRKVEAKLTEMEELADKGGALERIAGIAKSLHDNFSWAAKPLSAFLARIVLG